MAAKPIPKAVSAAKSVSVSYRAHRLDTFTWQGYELTAFDDGTYTEVAVFKPDLIDIVMHKIGQAIRQAGQVDFHNKKKQA